MIRFAEPDGFAEFGVATNFSFLRGASHPEELVAQAIALGLAGLGIADRNSLAGIVRAHLFLRHNKDQANGLRVVSGARLVFCDGTPDILAYPRDRAAYARLCRLLTTGNIRARKGGCLLRLADLIAWNEGPAAHRPCRLDLRARRRRESRRPALRGFRGGRFRSRVSPTIAPRPRAVRGWKRASVCSSLSSPKDVTTRVPPPPRKGKRRRRGLNHPPSSGSTPRVP